MTIPLAVNVTYATDSCTKWTISCGKRGLDRLLADDNLHNGCFRAVIDVRSQEFFSCRHTVQEDIVGEQRSSREAETSLRWMFSGILNRCWIDGKCLSSRRYKASVVGEDEGDVEALTLSTKIARLAAC